MGETKRPYVVYSIEADVRDKGVCFAVKRAIGVFLQHHNLEGRISDFNATSNHLQAKLEIFDNGNHDLNISALLDHVHSSGRLPSNEHHKPSIIIRPFSLDGYSQQADSKDDEHWVKTVEGLNSQLREKDSQLSDMEKTVSDLTNALHERQKVISAKSYELVSLQRKLESAVPVEFDDALSAVLEGYLATKEELLSDLCMDYDVLVKDGNLDTLVDNYEGLEFWQYLNYKHGSSFKDASDYDAWKKSMGSFQSWEDTPEAKSLIEEKKKVEIDKSVLEDAREKGASEEVLEALRKVIDGTKAWDIGERIEAQKQSFESDRELCSVLSDANEAYERFRGVVRNSSMRRGTDEFPIIVYTRSGSEEVYLPSFNSKDVFEVYLHEQLMLKECEPHSEGIVRSYCVPKICEVPVLAALGVSVRMIDLKELDT